MKNDFNKNWYFMCQMVTSDSQSARLIQLTFDANCGKIHYESDP